MAEKITPPIEEWEDESPLADEAFGIWAEGLSRPPDGFWKTVRRMTAFQRHGVASQIEWTLANLVHSIRTSAPDIPDDVRSLTVMASVLRWMEVHADRCRGTDEATAEFLGSTVRAWWDMLEGRAAALNEDVL